MKRWRDDDKKIVNVYQNILNSRGSILRYPLPPPPMDKDFHDFVKIFWMSLRPFKNDELVPVMYIFSGSSLPEHCFCSPRRSCHLTTSSDAEDETWQLIIIWSRLHLIIGQENGSCLSTFQVSRVTDQKRFRWGDMLYDIYIYTLGCFTYKSATFLLRIKAVFLHTY